MDQDILNINNFALSSYHDIAHIIENINSFKENKLLVHIVACQNDSTLARSLKEKIDETSLKVKVVLLDSEPETENYVTVFSLTKNVELDSISHEILKALHLENKNKKEDIQNYRTKLLSRYFTDHLTNLPNMYKLRKDLQENNNFCLVLVNIDNFKTINHFYGFRVGDYIIEEFGKYLKEVLYQYDVYRLTGAEFAFVLDNSMPFYDLKDYLTSLYEGMNNFLVSYQEIKIFLDITLASSAKRDSNQVFSKVSMAMKYAKEMRLPFWIYEDRMKFEDDYERNIKLSEIVRSAVESGRIVPYYQAIIDSQTSNVVKYECLARLIDTNEKVLSPLVFIPIAKKIKVYSNVTKLIIDKSFSKFENTDLFFSLNLSIEDIMSSDMYKFIMDKLKHSSAAKRVTFELLESEAVKDFTKVQRFIYEVKRYGASVAIDDFGSGYSNFSYLTKIQPDYIKIDGSLIKDIDVDKTAYLVVETIVDFAKKLEIKTIAEYVHTSVVMEKIRELGVDYAQGFYIEEPSNKISSYPK